MSNASAINLLETEINWLIEMELNEMESDYTKLLSDIHSATQEYVSEFADKCFRYNAGNVICKIRDAQDLCIKIDAMKSKIGDLKKMIKKLRDQELGK